MCCLLSQVEKINCLATELLNLIMRKSFFIAILCTSVSLCLVFFYNQALTITWTPVLHFIQRTDFNTTGKSLRDDENEQRQQRTREALRSSPKENDKNDDTATEETKPPQESFATRKNLIILSLGRGGSSFLGSFFDKNPRVMYCYEPLYSVAHKVFKVNLVPAGKEPPKKYREACIKVLNSFFQCDFSNLNHATLSAFSNSEWHRSMSTALSKQHLPKLSNTSLSKACQTYNHTVIKILSGRLPNKTIQNLKYFFQQQKQYDVKLVHLVRDPRAVVNSRVKLKWMKNHLDPSFHKNVQRICEPTLQNVRLGLLTPPPWLKNRFKVIRYEDLVVNTVNVTQELYKFAGFEWSDSVDKWIIAQAKNTKQKGAYSLFRNASAAIHGWKNAPKPFIKAVEDACGDLMDFLGYEKWEN